MEANLNDLSDYDIVKTANFPVGYGTPEAIKLTVNFAQNELADRKIAANSRLWEARVELQHAENAVRRLEGREEKEIRGVSGKLNED